jgi:nucleoid-associated protein YgaU
MLTRAVRVLLVVGVIGLALEGCTPQVTQRVDAARGAVESARAAGAPVRSAELFQLAEQNLKESESLLARGDGLSVLTSDWRAGSAIVAATAAVTTSKLQGEMDRVSAEARAANQQALLATAGAAAAAEAARVADGRAQQAGTQVQQVQTRVEQVEKQTAELKTQVASTPPPVTFIRYVVKRGDTLPKIAARSEIYGDARQWTRIYDANTEVVGRDRKLRTGLVLLIVKP